MVLDGDSRTVEAAVRSAAELHGAQVNPLFLPGESSPEDWTWRVLGQQGDDYAEELGLAPMELARRMAEIDRITEGGAHQGLGGDVRESGVAFREGARGIDAAGGEHGDRRGPSAFGATLRLPFGPSFVAVAA